jgi:hypothetical protein
MFPTVTGEITLAIAVDVETANHATIGHRRFPDGSVDDGVAPGDIARQTNIDGDQTGHKIISL